MALARRSVPFPIAGALLWATALAGCGSVEGPEPEPTPAPEPTIVSPSAVGGAYAGDAPQAVTTPEPHAQVRLGTQKLSFLVSTRQNIVPPQTVQLYNDTDQTVRIDAADIEDDASSILGTGGARSFALDPIQLPLIVGAGQSTEFTVRFVPPDDLMRLAVLVIRTSDAATPRLTVSLMGKIYVDPRDSM